MFLNCAKRMKEDINQIGVGVQSGEVEGGVYHPGDSRHFPPQSSQLSSALFVYWD